MKLDSTNFRGGLTLIEVLVVIGVLIVLWMMLLPSVTHCGPRAPRINCVNNLRQIELALKTWAVYNGDKWPMDLSFTNNGTRESAERGVVFTTFLKMSNELSAPKLLICPADNSRKVAASFPELLNVNASYFVELDVTPTNAETIVLGDRNLTLNDIPVKPGLISIATNSLLGWTDEIHLKQGNIGLADGSVQQLSTPKLRNALEHSEFVTNRLAVP